MITGMVKRVINNIVKHQMDVHLWCVMCLKLIGFYTHNNT